jgi:hypothetical protein
MARVFSYLLDALGVRTIKSYGSSLAATKGLNFKTPMLATYNASTGEIDIDAAFDGGSAALTITKAASYTIDGTEYGSLDPSSTRLIVQVTAAATITFPSSPVAGQEITVAKIGGGSFSVSIASPGQDIHRTLYPPASGVINTDTFSMSGTTTPAFASTWRYDGTNTWACLSVPRDRQSVTATAMRVASNSVVCNDLGSTGNGRELTIGEGTVLLRKTGSNMSAEKIAAEHIGPLLSSDSRVRYAAVPEARQTFGSLASSSSQVVACATSVANSSTVTVYWRVRLDGVRHDILSVYDKDAGGVVTVQQFKSVFDAPADVTIEATTTGSSIGLTITNGTVSSIAVQSVIPSLEVENVA